jgi:hypothetical protein
MRFEPVSSFWTAYNKTVHPRPAPLFVAGKKVEIKAPSLMAILVHKAKVTNIRMPCGGKARVGGRDLLDLKIEKDLAEGKDPGKDSIEGEIGPEILFGEGKSLFLHALCIKGKIPGHKLLGRKSAFMSKKLPDLLRFHTKTIFNLLAEIEEKLPNPLLCFRHPHLKNIIRKGGIAKEASLFPPKLKDLADEPSIVMRRRGCPGDCRAVEFLAKVARWGVKHNRLIKGSIEGKEPSLLPLLPGFALKMLNDNRRNTPKRFGIGNLQGVSMKGIEGIAREGLGFQDKSLVDFLEPFFT